MNKSGKLDLFHAVSVEAPSGGIKLTNHMYQVWHRFDKSKEFHLNSDRSKLKYIVWYFCDFASNRSFDISGIAFEVFEPLTERLFAEGPINVFSHALWIERFQHNPNFNIHSTQGYNNFASALLNANYFTTIRMLLPPGLVERAQRRVFGNNKSAVSSAACILVESTSLYRDKYTDLSSWVVREAFNFDIICHKVMRDGVTEFVTSEMKTFWSEPVFKNRPHLSRLIAAFASFAPSLKGLLNSERDLYDKADEVVDWFYKFIIPVFPTLVQFADPPDDLISSSSGGTYYPPQVRLKLAKYQIEYAPGDSNEEIDLLLIGPFSAGSGLGTGTRRSVSALEELNCNFRVINCLYDNPSSNLEPIPEKLAYKGEKPHITLWHYNAEYLPEVLMTLKEFHNPKLNICYFFWETEAMPEAHKLGRMMADEIWVPSDFVRSCYSGGETPVFNVGTSVDLPKFEKYLPKSSFGIVNEFTFMFSFDHHSVIHRKNPAAVVRAFQQAFLKTDNVKLVLKTQNYDNAHWGSINGRNEELFELCENDPRISLINKTMTLYELYSLKSAVDCYVSLHRSEGFGYGPAEAMALGKPTIMTNYSANTEFGDNGASMLVDAKTVHVLRDEYLYWTPEMIWADPDIEIASSYMRKLYDDREFALELGRRGQERILREFGRSNMAAKYRSRLVDLGLLHDI